MNEGGTNFAMDLPPYAFLFIVPLHFFSLLFLHYQVFFIVKTANSIEVQIEVKSNTFLSEFFLIYCLLNGICFLQPKLYQFLQDDSREEFV